MSEYVLIFSLGPVQSFIAEARRTQDLYAGSYILAELSRAAAGAAGGELVYPASEMLKASNSGVPNKFVNIVDDPRTAARNARKEAEKKWHDFGKDALKSGKLPDTDDKEFAQIWNRQLAHHLEFYWAAAPLVNGDYTRAYQEASKALDARKRTRDFEQVEEDGLKDSLSGRRSALRTAKDGGRNADARARAYWQRVLEAQSTQAMLKKGERLDAIGAVKRFVLDRPFPSASTAASAPFARSCRNAGLLHELDNLFQVIEAFNRVGDWGRGFPYDGDLLYEETYARGRLLASYGLAPPPDEVVAALKRLYKAAEANDIYPARPTPYYAILALDGDWMGKHIAACRTKEKHAELSHRLAKFANQAQNIIQERGGYAVYIGGDDVLAFFPLESALGGAAALAHAYGCWFADWTQYAPDGTRLPFTVSAGIAIAHHLQPLDIALEEARAAERRAKNRYGRDAVCISALKRSGEPVRVGSKWGSAGFKIEDWIQRVVEDLRKRLAARLVYELHDQVTALGTVDEAMLALLLKRLLKRHHRKEDEPLQTQPEDLMAWVNAIVREGVEVEDSAAAELSRWLLLAQFLAKGGVE